MLFYSWGDKLKYIKEIYLTKSDIKEIDWINLIDKINSYIRIFTSWKIIILNKDKEIRYFIISNIMLPITINNQEKFLLKKIKKLKLPPTNYTLLSYTQKNYNFIDLIDKYKMKNQNLESATITFTKLPNNKFLSSTNIYLRKEIKLVKKHLLLHNPISILNIDFSNNKRYFYKKQKKYLEIDKNIKYLSTNNANSILKVNKFPLYDNSYYLNHNSFDFNKHSLIVGSSGTGKSKLISLLVNNIFNSKEKLKYKFIIIDPHASLEYDIGGLGKVIDFKDTLNSINLFSSNKKDIIEETELLLELLKNLIKDQYNSKLERVLRHSIYLLLTANTFNFENLRNLLLNMEYRNKVLNENKSYLPTSITQFFLTDFNNLRLEYYNETISPIISFIDEIELTKIFNDNKNLNLEETIKSNFLTLFSLNRTVLGSKGLYLISGLIMEQLFLLIENKKIKEHLIFIIDEVPVVENKILESFLSEARKFNLSLILICQYFNQISESLKLSIFSNTINYFIFRVSRMDANILVNSFDMKIPLDNTLDAKINLFTGLNNRECIARISIDNKLQKPFKGTTTFFKSIPRIINNESKIDKASITQTNKKLTNKVLINKSENFSIDNEKINKNKNFSINKNIDVNSILKINNTSKKEIIK